MLTIFRGDDTSYGDFERKVCIYIKTTQDLTGWTATFQLIDNVKTFTDLTNGYVAFSYTSAETMDFPLGKTYATLKLFDSKGQTRSVKKIDVEVENQVPVMDAGIIAVSADCVVADYKSIGNLPKINGKTVEGDHDGAYYGLGSAEDVALCAACNAAQAVEIEALKVTTQQNATSISDQGVAIARNTQELIGCKQSAAKCIKDVEQLKAKVESVDAEIDAKVGAEEAARKADTGSIRDELEAERTARKAADSSLRGDLETEKTKRGRDKAELNTKISTETSNRETDVARLEDELGSEKAMRESADASLESKLGAAKSELGSKIETVSDNVDELRDGVKNDLIYLKGKIDDADARLEQKIGDEEVARTKAVSNEAATRKAEDDRIEEKTKQTFIEVKAKLNNEIRQRELVQNSLASEIIRSKAADETNEKAVANESTTRAKEDEKVLAAAKAYTDEKGASALHYRGQVATLTELYAITKKEPGDIYNVIETGANYAWNGGEWDKLSEDIDLTPYAKKTELAEEKARAEGKEAELASAVSEETRGRTEAIEAEATSRKSADDVLTEAVATEASTARAKEEAIGLRIDGVESDYKTADDGIRAEIGTKVAALNAKDSELDARITNITKDTDGLIATEREARKAADAAEKDARVKAVKAEEDARKGAIETEKSAREAADGTLDAKIDGEKSDRETADGLLRTDMENLINEEKTRATNAEDALGTRITTAKSDLTTAIEGAKTLLNHAIENEKTRAAGAEEGLGTRIDTEIADRKSEVKRVEDERKAADKKLTDDLADEVENRTNADSAIRTDFASADDEVLAKAKEYADTVGAKAMHFKGYVENRSALEAKSGTASQGDMYNVGSYEMDDGTIVKGANFAWTGSAWDKLSETIDLSPYAKSAEVTAKINEVKTALEEKDAAQDTLIGAVTAKAAKNEADIATANGKVTTLQTDLGTLTAKVNKAIADHATDIAEVKGLVSAEEIRAKGEVADTKLFLQGEDTKLGNRITTEEGKRASEITRIEGLIGAEAVKRETLSTNLTKAINDEVGRATAAETSLLGQISDEIQDRQDADNEISEALGAERDARAAAEHDINTAITAMDAAYKAADTALGQQIAEAIVTCKKYTDDKYKSVDGEIEELQHSIDECNRAVNTWQTQITETRTNLENEITRAKAREDGLDARLDASVTSADKAMPKSYVDAVDAKLDDTVSSSDKAMPKSYVDAVDGKFATGVSSADPAQPKSYIDAIDAKFADGVSATDPAKPKSYIDNAVKDVDDKLDTTVTSSDPAMPKSYVDNELKKIKEGAVPVQQLAFTSTSAGAAGKSYTLTVVLEDGEPTIQLVETPAS